MENLLYLAAALKFSAVPAAGFELIGTERRNAVEKWLLEKLPKLVSSFGITLLVLYVSVFLLVIAGPYFLLFFLVFGRLILLGIMSGKNQDDVSAYMVVSFVLWVGVFIAAILEKWVFPESWILAIAYPFEFFSVWVNGITYLDYLIPDFSGKGFLDNFRNVFLAIEEWLWDWLAFMNGLYFFIARGFMLLMVILIQILFFFGVVFGVMLIVGFPVHLFIQSSDYAKRRLHISQSHIPWVPLFFGGLENVSILES